ncbi:MAG TPA: hypothetical protein VFD82_08265 [Planctomycetota bacterium]|nr:hypothetical protein [Planctomycetota bacterium]
MLAALLVLFLVAFWVQRGRSSYLAIEQHRAEAEAVAAQFGLPVQDAMALRDLAGAYATESAWREVVSVYAGNRAQLGDALAAVAAAGGRAAALEALQAAGDPERAWSAFRLEPGAVPGLRFLAMRERFAARKPGRD